MSFNQIDTYKRALKDLRAARRNVCLEMHKERLKWKPDDEKLQALNLQLDDLEKDIQHYQLELAIYVENNLFNQ